MQNVDKNCIIVFLISFIFSASKVSWFTLSVFTSSKEPVSIPVFVGITVVFVSYQTVSYQPVNFSTGFQPLVQKSKQTLQISSSIVPT